MMGIEDTYLSVSTVLCWVGSSRRSEGTVLNPDEMGYKVFYVLRVDMDVI